MKYYFVAAAACLMATGLVQAQERAAAGTLDTQMTWSALKGLVDAANAKSDGALQQLGKVAECGKLGKVYAPGDPDAINGCKEAGTASSLSIFAVRAGFDAGPRMAFTFNLATGVGQIIGGKTYGRTYVLVPKLDIDTVCHGKTPRTIELLTIAPWYGMPLASGHRLDETQNAQLLQQPTCANGLVGMGEVTDNDPSLANDEWSIGSAFLMKAN